MVVGKETNCRREDCFLVPGAHRRHCGATPRWQTRSLASTLPELKHSPSPHLQDSLGGGIQVHNNRTRADDDDAVSNTIDGPGDVARVLSEVLEVDLGANRLLQMRDQGAHQLHALSCIERDRTLWRRYRNMSASDRR